MSSEVMNLLDSRNNEWVLWLGSISTTVSISFRSISVHTWFQNTSQMSLEWQIVIASLFLCGNMQSLRNWKESTLVLIHTIGSEFFFYLAAGTDFTTLSQSFAIHKWIVSKCAWDYEQLLESWQSGSMWSPALLFRFCPHLCFLLYKPLTAVYGNEVLRFVRQGCQCWEILQNPEETIFTFHSRGKIKLSHMATTV